MNRGSAGGVGEDELACPIDSKKFEEFGWEVSRSGRGKKGAFPNTNLQMHEKHRVCLGKRGKSPKNWSTPGIEPGTSSTLKTNHTPRPSGLACL